MYYPTASKAISHDPPIWSLQSHCTDEKLTTDTKVIDFHWFILMIMTIYLHKTPRQGIVKAI